MSPCCEADFVDGAHYTYRCVKCERGFEKPLIQMNMTEYSNMKFRRLMTGTFGKGMTEEAMEHADRISEIHELRMGNLEYITMTQALQEEIMNQVFEECSKIRAVAQQEYAHDPMNAHANFDRIAEYLKIDAKKILFTYMYKHIDGIAAYVNGFESQREGVKNRINDVIVYLILLRGLFERDAARAGKDKL